MNYENLSPVSSERNQEGPPECRDTTTTLSATANTTFYTVFIVFWRKIMAAAVSLSLSLSLHSNNLLQLCNDYTITQMVHIHNYSCIRKW
jgi:hypothetical protein